MSEIAAPTPELPPQVSGLLGTMRALVANPPAGFETNDRERIGRTPHAISSVDRIPGYWRESTHMVETSVGDSVLLGKVSLPGTPLANGTPSIRHYEIYYDGRVQLWGFYFPHPDKIRTIGSEVMAMLPPKGEMAILRDGLLFGINQAVDERLSSQQPESLGPAAYLDLGEIEDLNHELEAIAQNGIS